MIAPEIAILLLAMAIDQFLGEPPAVAHPVVWMGKVIGLLERLCPRSPFWQLVYGTVLAVGVVGFFGVGTFLVLDWLRNWNVVAYVLVGAYLLKGTFAVRELRQAALRVFASLSAGEIGAARSYLRHLVSRDTEQLDEPLVVAATVESVAENVTDSFLAPLLFYLILGVPGAIAYRATNTLDSMIGYRGRYEYLGKFAARFDDVVNFIPSRLAAILLVLATGIVRADIGRAWRIMLRDHALTASPNAGWTMSAMSGALGIQLEKCGHYRLGDPISDLSPLKILRAIKIIYVAVALALLLSLLMSLLIEVLGNARVS